MFNQSFIFENAAWLWLLALLPILWWLSRRSLAGLGRWRRYFAVGLRSVVMALLILALAGMQSQKTSDSITVIYLLDQSLSIPETQRRAMVDYVNASINRQRKDDKRDKGGVIVFGRDAAVELAPVDTYIPLLPNTESLLDPEYTDLGGAMRRASALFTGDSAKRIVVVSDGNENLGDALRQARALIESGVSIDTVAVPLPARDEISVVKVTVPADARKDQPFDLRVVLNRETAGPNSKKTVRGKLRVIRKTGEREEVIAEQTDIELPAGKKFFSVPEIIEQADFYTYEAQFIPDDPNDDGTSRNNSATTFTHVRGRGHVLLIEDHDNRGEFDYLVGHLRTEGLEVSVRPSDRAFASLPELQRYDSVILANVPRASGGSLADVPSFSDDQIEMLVSNTRLGCGLLMLGGPNSYGAGGWTGTKLEEAMPVDFQIKNAKVAPVGALVLMMHAGEMPKANYWQKKVSIEAIKALGYQDWCGMVQWSGREDWLWNRTKGGMLKVGPNRKTMLSRVDRMMIGDMPDFDAPMKMAVTAFQKLENSSAKPAVRHMIIISDGDANAPANSTITALIKLRVTVTTVSVPSHGSSDVRFQRLMKDIATRTGGKFYVIRSGKALPRIYQREVRRISRPLIKEMPAPGISPQLISQHEMVKGISTDLPPITGFVMTSLKDSPLVEVVLASPSKSVPEQNSTILAAWTYGLGKSVVWTTDSGKRWATAWTGWEGYDRFFSQVVRWSMRPLGDTGKFSVATDVQDGKTHIVVTALDEDDAFLNFQTMAGMVIGPDMKMSELRIEQVAPGRYEGEFESQQSGSYSVAVIPGARKAPILTGVNVGYSSEYSDRKTNRPLLQSIAELPVKGGEPGKLIDGSGEESELKEMLALNPFRRDLPKATSVQDIWPWLVMLGSCLFLADVFVRRVQVGFEWLPPLAARVRDKILRRSGPIEQEKTMSRLKSRKAEIGAAIDERRAGARFMVAQDAAEAIDEVEALKQAAQTSPMKTPHKPKQELSPDAEHEEESYTSRLLKAKKQVWKDRDEKK